jgi:ketosteroid isomerase-like protein
LFARDAILTDPTGRYKGPDAIQAYMESADEPFTEPMNETFLLIEEGDTFVAEWVWRATHTETGEAVEIPGLSVFLVRDGKVASDPSLK